MKSTMKNTVKLLCLGLFALLCGCRSPQIRPEIVPAVEVKTAPQHTLGIIGGVEPVYFLPMKTPAPPILPLTFPNFTNLSVTAKNGFLLCW